MLSATQHAFRATNLHLRPQNARAQSQTTFYDELSRSRWLKVPTSLPRQAYAGKLSPAALLVLFEVHQHIQRNALRGDSAPALSQRHLANIMRPYGMTERTVRGALSTLVADGWYERLDGETAARITLGMQFGNAPEIPRAFYKVPRELMTEAYQAKSSRADVLLLVLIYQLLHEAGRDTLALSLEEIYRKAGKFGISPSLVRQRLAKLRERGLIKRERQSCGAAITFLARRTPTGNDRPAARPPCPAPVERRSCPPTSDTHPPEPASKAAPRPISRKPRRPTLAPDAELSAHARKLLEERLAPVPWKPSAQPASNPKSGLMNNHPHQHSASLASVSTAPARKAFTRDQHRRIRALIDAHHAQNRLSNPHEVGCWVAWQLVFGASRTRPFEQAIRGLDTLIRTSRFRRPYGFDMQAAETVWPRAGNTEPAANNPVADGPCLIERPLAPMEKILSRKIKPERCQNSNRADLAALAKSGK